MEFSGMFLFLLCFVIVGTNCKMIYVPRITDKVFNCENFDNTALDCSGLELGSNRDADGNEIGKLGGKIVTKKEIISDYDIEVDIWKQLDIGDEYMYNTRANFCSSLENTDSPWYPVIQNMNITSCPVPISDFEVQELTVSLACAKDVMCHEFCGDYRIELSFVDVTDKISCHTIFLCIVEEEVEDDEDDS